MRYFVALAILIDVFSTAMACDADRDRAAAALALVSTSRASPETNQFRVEARTALALHCGNCRGDLERARSDARKANRTLVIFVGGCDTQGLAAASSGAIIAATASYTADGRPAGEKRVVVIYPAPTGELWIDRTLIGAPISADLKNAIAEATTKISELKPTTTLNWMGGVPTVIGPNCPNGRCPVVSK